MARFHWRVRNGLVWIGAERFMFPPPKVGGVRTWLAVLISQCSSVGVPRGLKGAKKFEGRHTPSVDYSKESSLLCNRGKIINKHSRAYPQGISGPQRKLRLLKKMSRKSLSSFLDILHRCSLFDVSRSSFLLDFLAGYTLLGCYEVTMLT